MDLNLRQLPHCVLVNVFTIYRFSQLEIYEFCFHTEKKIFKPSHINTNPPPHTGSCKKNYLHGY